MVMPLTKGHRILEQDPVEELVYVFYEVYPQQDKIQQALKRFFHNNENPTESGYVRKEIAQSWLRSKNLGVVSDSDPLKNKIHPTVLKSIFKNNHLLIRAVKSILYKDLAFLRRHSDFTVFLYDHNSIVLFYLHNEKDIDTNGYTGLELSEQTVGTNSHSLCIHLNKPFLTISTENINKRLQEISAAVSVPIRNPKGDVIGALTFSYPERDDWSLTSPGIFRAIISFQIALVNKIEKELKKAEQNSSLFHTVCSLCDDSMILVNKHGHILNMNSFAEKLLGAPEKIYKGKSITKVLGKETPLLNALKESKPISNFPLYFISQGQKKDCVMQLIPCDLVGGAFIRLSPVNIASTNVSNRINNLGSLYTFSDILGDSPELAKVKKLAEKFAQSPHNILLLGESGTGKELFAHSIHHIRRPEGPFITINCAAMPKELIESELFGYEGGSFTGADPKGKAGKLEMADKGTLFLDEIGDMPLELQPIFLRVLESKRLMRIGGKRYINSDFRVIAATNKNIQKLVAQKQFREDLYYRLSSLKLVIPPLRERGQDIIVLARDYIYKQCKKYNFQLPEMEANVYNALLSYSWPGNIRELQNALDTALSVAENGVIKITDLPLETYNHNSTAVDVNEFKTLDEAEKQAIHEALRRTGCNIKQTADILGISRTTLYQKLKKYNISTSKKQD